MLIDTHCHIHWANFGISPDEVIENARQNDVTKMICVGTNYEDSLLATEFAKDKEGVYSSVGIHPHYANDPDLNLLESFLSDLCHKDGFAPRLSSATASGQARGADVFLIKDRRENSSLNSKLVAIGEIGLDYYRSETTREDQIKLLQQQIELAIKHDLPIIFHVRDAFDDFWQVFDNFKGSKIRGVLHSFTDSQKNAEQGLKRGLYIGINGISTFVKDEAQKSMYGNLPLDKILLETDAPFLTPNPLRGKIDVNEPAHVKEIAEYNAELRGISFDEISKVTTENATSLFNL